MKDIDEVRGYHRDILFNPEHLYTTSGGTELTNCLVEAVENDWKGNAPVLSLRFYHKPEKLVYEEHSPIGVELTLSIELAHSLIEQIKTKWPELQTIAEDEADDELPNS